MEIGLWQLLNLSIEGGRTGKGILQFTLEYRLCEKKWCRKGNLQGSLLFFKYFSRKKYLRGKEVKRIE